MGYMRLSQTKNVEHKATDNTVVTHVSSWRTLPIKLAGKCFKLVVGIRFLAGYVPVRINVGPPCLSSDRWPGLQQTQFWCPSKMRPYKWF